MPTYKVTHASLFTTKGKHVRNDVVEIPKKEADGILKMDEEAGRAARLAPSKADEKKADDKKADDKEKGA